MPLARSTLARGLAARWPLRIDKCGAWRHHVSPVLLDLSHTGQRHRMRLSLSSFVELQFLHARVRSSNFQLNRIGLIRIMTISVPQLGHDDEASASGGVSGTCHV